MPAPNAERLLAVQVLDREGNARPLGEVTGGSPTLLVFLRHFAWIACSSQVGELSPRLPEIHELGLRTVLVGNGAPNFIDGFVERTGLADKEVTIVTDPSLEVFRAAELVRSFWATAGPRAMRDAARAFRKGYRQTGIEGDKTQQGGVIIFDREGKIIFHHANQSLGDHASPDKIVEAAAAARS